MRLCIYHIYFHILRISPLSVHNSPECLQCAGLYRRLQSGAAWPVSWPRSSRTFLLLSRFMKEQIWTQPSISPAVFKKKKPNPKSKIALSALKLWEDKGNAFGEGDVAPFAAVRGGRSGAANTVIALYLLMYALPLLCWGTAGGKKHLVSFTEPLNRKYF